MKTLEKTRIDKLIELATEKMGTEYRLAKSIGYEQQAFTKWKSGKSPCPLEAQALMAAVAGLNANEVIAVAILERNADKPRFEKLELALGKIYAGMNGVGLVAIAASVGWVFEQMTVVYNTQCVLQLSKKRQSRRFFHGVEENKTCFLSL